jgi:hypothetical protein
VSSVEDGNNIAISCPLIVNLTGEKIKADVDSLRSRVLNRLCNIEMWKWLLALCLLKDIFLTQLKTCEYIRIY